MEGRERAQGEGGGGIGGTDRWLRLVRRRTVGVTSRIATIDSSFLREAFRPSSIGRDTGQSFISVPSFLDRFASHEKDNPRIADMAEDTVPITRELLREFYADYPLQPLCEDAEKLRKEMEAYLWDDDGGKEGLEEIVRAVPHKIDENYFRTRERCEEVAHLLRRKLSIQMKCQEETFQAMADGYFRVEEAIRDMQRQNTQYITKMVSEYLPQDFRGYLIQQQKDRTELQREQEVAVLVEAGGSIQEKYELLWKHQMDRREALAQLGHATGIYKALVTYIGGVPQVLLDFIKEINAEEGPMEEQRITYGPVIYSLTEFIGVIFCFASFLSETTLPLEDVEKCTSLLKSASDLYVKEEIRVLDFMGSVFQKSPFLVSSSKFPDRKSPNMKGQYLDLDIVAGDGKEVAVDVEDAGMRITWEFSCSSGDVGFSVIFYEKEGKQLQMIPLTRHAKHEGQFSSPAEGICKLMFDNSHSYFYSKQVRYKVCVVPPLGERNDVL